MQNAQKKQNSRINELKTELNYIFNHTPEQVKDFKLNLNNYREISEIRKYLSKHPVGRNFYLKEAGDDMYMLAQN